MSRLDDELDRAPAHAPAGARPPAGPAGLVDVECVACRRRFSTDSGICPWCGHGAVLTVAFPAPAASTTATLPPRRQSTRIVGARAGVVGTVACVALFLGAVGVIRAVRAPGRAASGAADTTAPGTARTTAPARSASAAPAPPDATPASSAPANTTPVVAPVVPVDPVAVASTATSTAPTTASLPAAPADPPVSDTTGAPGTTSAPTSTTEEPVGLDARSIAVVEAYARAMSAHDWATAGGLIPSVVATPADYAVLYAAMDTMDLLVLTSGPGPTIGTRVVRAGQVLVEHGADGRRMSRLLCAHYVVDPAAGVLRSVRPTAIGTVDGAVTARLVRDQLAGCSLA